MSRIVTDAEIFQHRGTVRRAIRFDTLLWRFPADNRWKGAIWEFRADNAVTHLPVEPIEEITATSGMFNIIVIDGQGRQTGPFSVQSATCGYPNHSFCYLFRVGEDDLWSGHTVSRSFGELAIVPYRFDPS